MERKREDFYISQGIVFETMLVVNERNVSPACYSSIEQLTFLCFIIENPLCTIRDKSRISNVAVSTILQDISIRMKLIS